jgi:Fur family transcriptional regulator, ferric uptake regulator
LAAPPHHHVLCDTCGTLTDVPAATLAATLAAAQAATGYALTTAGLTLLGCCPACQQASPNTCHSRASHEAAPQGVE